jgi:hypothetical protein
MSRPALMVLLSLLALVTLAYFVFVFLRADALAAVLLRARYGERGWTQARLASRLRLLGTAGILVAIAALAIAVTKIVG